MIKRLLLGGRRFSGITQKSPSNCKGTCKREGRGSKSEKKRHMIKEAKTGVMCVEGVHTPRNVGSL